MSGILARVTVRARGNVRRAAILACAAGLAACARPAAVAPAGANQGGGPSAIVELVDTIPGPMLAVWNRTMQVFADSGFRIERGTGDIFPRDRGVAYASDTVRGVWMVMRYSRLGGDTIIVRRRAESLDDAPRSPTPDRRRLEATVRGLSAAHRALCGTFCGERYPGAVAVISPTTSRPPVAPWRGGIVPWREHSDTAQPWRQDPRFRGREAPGYPDDFQVMFFNPDSATGGLHEVMWVRTFAHDPRTDQYLGVLLNKPDFLRSVTAGDNVVFHFPADRQFPVAIAEPSYGETGWPRYRAAHLLTLRDGIRAYRLGQNGHVMPEIERCIAILDPLVRAWPQRATDQERFVGHFVLGRCLAEKYETRRAIEQFQLAVAYDPDDLHAHMALLAEYSVITHRPPGEFSADEEAHWERAFVEQLSLVRTRFATDRRVASTLGVIFDPPTRTEVAGERLPHDEKLRRVGYGIFRWKLR